jgi:hypothetical protein
MQMRPSGCRPSIFAGIVFLVGAVFAIPIAGSIGCSQAETAARRGGAPATVAEAAAALDLTKLPLVEGAVEPEIRRVGSLNYNAPGKVAEVFATHRKQLIDQGWRQLPDAQSTDQFASATFARDGFLLAVGVFSAGMPGVVSVAITHLGNVDLEKLPVPGNAELVFPGAASVAFVTDMPPEPALEECRKLLGEKGWQPYGTASQTLVLKQNAVRLTARIAAAAGQAGKTMVTYSAALMSADLPAPADAEGVQYHDQTAELMFDTTATPDQIVDFYRQTLAKTGWEATTDRPIKIDSKQRLILRNPSHDLLALEIDEVADKRRVRVQCQSAAEIAELDRQLKALRKLKPEG